MSLERIHVCQSIPEAAVLESLLQAADIPACFQGTHHANVAWHHLFALGGIPVLVPHQTASKARELIFHEKKPKMELRESELCLRAPIRNALIAGLVLIFFGVIFPFWIRQRIAVK